MVGLGIMLDNYSFFYIRAKGLDEQKLISFQNKHSHNKIWECIKLEVGEVATHRLNWIDVIQYDNHMLLGQTDFVKLRLVTGGLVVFTMSYSALSLIRSFLKEELNIATIVKLYTRKTFLSIINGSEYVVQQIYIKEQHQILPATLDYVKSSKGEDIFGIEFISRAGSLLTTIMLFSFGLVKLPYKLTINELVRIFDVLDIRFTSV